MMDLWFKYRVCCLRVFKQGLVGVLLKSVCLLGSLLIFNAHCLKKSVVNTNNAEDVIECTSSDDCPNDVPYYCKLGHCVKGVEPTEPTTSAAITDKCPCRGLQDCVVNAAGKFPLKEACTSSSYCLSDLDCNGHGQCFYNYSTHEARCLAADPNNPPHDKCIHNLVNDFLLPSPGIGVCSATNDTLLVNYANKTVLPTSLPADSQNVYEPVFSFDILESGYALWLSNLKVGEGLIIFYDFRANKTLDASCIPQFRFMNGNNVYSDGVTYGYGSVALQSLPANVASSLRLGLSVSNACALTMTDKIKISFKLVKIPAGFCYPSEGGNTTSPYQSIVDAYADTNNIPALSSGAVYRVSICGGNANLPRQEQQKWFKFTVPDGLIQKLKIQSTDFAVPMSAKVYKVVTVDPDVVDNSLYILGDGTIGAREQKISLEGMAGTLSEVTVPDLASNVTYYVRIVNNEATFANTYVRLILLPQL